VAGVGVIFADSLGWEPTGAAVQVAALSAALACALLLTWTERRWPEVQEAIIGVVFVIASSAAILLLAKNPHGGENLRELLIGTDSVWSTRRSCRSRRRPTARFSRSGSVFGSGSAASVSTRCSPAR
jgi:ABC-type Mn2+/Zn2+ transport system permease subunit